ncbi:hypothetical protein NE237_000821 [Protea cynaroides]|uniref:Uncharacterized protein n=1 Tax=Protea cynaroides TaxID=273540 RepID=A0A9Q0QXH8_9MAGN|nr:hypothetical protein NE237_000821 [Protea cynaroides]
MSNSVKKYPAKEFSTPPRTLKSALCSPIPPTENHRSSPNVRADSFHVIHKVPAGDSPYVKAKHVQLIDKDPSKAISLFWSSINSGDRVDSALKDMAIVMKQLDRSDEAIEAIKSFRHLCPLQTQESLDNILIDLYKRCGRFEEQIQLLQHKLKLVEEGSAFGGKRTKIARSQGRKLHVTIDQERSRLLGNLAWAYMQQNNYQTAEEIYWKALSIEPDKNKHCNLAVCLMHRGQIEEAKSLLQEIAPSTKEREVGDSYIKSFDRACEILAELESQSILSPFKHTEETKDAHRSLTPINKSSNSLTSFINEDWNQGFDFLGCRKWEDENYQELKYLEVNLNSSLEKQKKISCSRNLFENEVGISSLEKRRSSDETDYEEISAQNWRNTNGTPQYASFQPRSVQQFNERPLYVDKWDKGVYSKKGLERISGLQKGRCTSDTRIEESFANNGTDNNANVFNLTVSDHGNLKPIGTGTICSSSQYSIGPGWKRSGGAESCCAVPEGSSNTKLLIEQSIPIEKAHVPPLQKLTFNSGDEDHMSETTVLGIDRKNVGRNNDYEVDNVYITGNPKSTKDFSIFKSKSWADMVEEEEAEEEFSTSKLDFMTNGETNLSQDSSVSFQSTTKWIDECNYGESFHDENLNSNIISAIPPHSITATRPLLQLPPLTHPSPKNYAENLRQKLQATDLKGYSRSTGEVRNPVFQHKWDSADYYASASPKRGSGSSCLSNIAKAKWRPNRLQVFREITPDSPRT